MTDPDHSWAGVPLSGNEHIAGQAKGYVDAAHKAAQKIDVLADFLRELTGRGSDADGIVVVTVDQTRSVRSVVFDERCWRGMAQDRAERAATEAVNLALADLGEKRAGTIGRFTRGFDIEEQRLPTLHDLYLQYRPQGQHGEPEDVTGRGSDPDMLVTVVADRDERIKGVVFNRQQYGSLTRERAGGAIVLAANTALRLVRAQKLAAQRRDLEEQGLGHLLDAQAVFTKIFPEQMEQRRKRQQQGGPR